MILTDFPRDLLMTGAIFGVAAFAWTGWAQVVSVVVPDRAAARSFWCGLLGGGTLLVVGWVCAAAGFEAVYFSRA